MDFRDRQFINENYINVDDADEVMSDEHWQMFKAYAEQPCNILHWHYEEVLDFLSYEPKWTDLAFDPEPEPEPEPDDSSSSDSE